MTFFFSKYFFQLIKFLKVHLFIYLRETKTVRVGEEQREREGERENSMQALHCFNWHIVDTQCYIRGQVYKIVVTQLYILYYTYHKCTYHVSPHNTITIPLAKFPMLYHLFPWLIHSITGGLQLLLTFPHIAHPSPPPLWQPSTCSLYLWVCFCFFIV